MAAAASFLLVSRWPDIVVGSLIAGLFLHSAIDVLRRAVKAWRASRKSSVTVKLTLDAQQRR
jgi:Co/Zn/Cd efflux system component